MKNIPIVIAAYNRPHALQRLLNALKRADYPEKVKLIFSIDCSDSAAVIEIAKNFTWAFGDKEIIVHSQHLGLKKHILSCGDLSKDYDGVILLEDDLYVSPVFYHYVSGAFDAYKDDRAIAGISLYSHGFNETAAFPFIPLSDDSDVFFLQIAASWGVCWSKDQWSRFRNWYAGRTSASAMPQTMMPGDVLRWPETSWKKYFIEYLIHSNTFFAYPRRSLTTNFGDSGEHHHANSYFQVPLQYRKKEYRFKPFGDSLSVYDSFCEILPSRLSVLAPELAQYDFVVDLYGMKPKEQYQHKHILTIKQCRDFMFTYGRELLPPETNVIEQIKGDRIFFADGRNCEGYENYRKYRRKRCTDMEEITYYYNMKPVSSRAVSESHTKWQPIPPSLLNLFQRKKKIRK